MMTMILVLDYLAGLLRLQLCAIVTRGAIAGEATNHASSWLLVVLDDREKRAPCQCTRGGATALQSRAK